MDLGATLGEIAERDVFLVPTDLVVTICQSFTFAGEKRKSVAASRIQTSVGKVADTFTSKGRPRATSWLRNKAFRDRGESP